MSLDKFSVEFDRALAGQFPTFKTSGVAKRYYCNGKILYSASVYPSDATELMPTPNDAMFVFDKITVGGFKFDSLEILEFSSTSPLPLPKWRIQLEFVVV